MEPWINYHHLLYFKTIAEEASVSKAAEKLRLGQPTLSAQLKQFEESLGVQLFERQHKKLLLTEQGKIALEYAQNIFKLGNEMYEALHDRLSPSRVHLQIGALDSVPKELILQLARNAYDQGPASISLIEGSMEFLVRELLAHRIDLIVSDYLPSSSDLKSIVHKVLLKKSVSIFGSPDFKNLKKNFPNSVSGQKFVLPTYNSRLRYDIEHWAKLNSIRIDTIAETQDISLKKMMATEGMGLIPAAHYNVAELVNAGQLVEIGNLTGITEEIHLMSTQRKISNPIASRIMKNFTMNMN